MTSPPFEARMTAREVIDDIREELGVGEGILQEIALNKRIQRVFSNQQSLTQNAVRELSTGLYQEDTHFILELIQNADDNRYEDYIEPTIAFTVTPGFFRVDCNECGFSERDVRAICHLGKSTKKAKKVEGYIGEKGIGFKSVFKVAQIVHIKSADYTFKFDTTLPELGPTGMLAPTWSSFPDAETVPKHTQILLELIPNYDAGELEEKLEALQRTLLLFLRRLRRIEINTSKGSRVFTRQDEPNDSKVFLRERINYPLIPVPSVSTLEYLLISHVLDTLPAEPKRSGIDSTQILLAFPVQDSSATATKQLVYAFLPVKHFGFNFLIQADFLLSSSREDIQECAWNRCLRAGIKEAFSKAVGKFNKVAFLMYTWPRYLSTSTYSGTFLSELATQGGSIAKELRHHHILWSRANTLQAPTALTRIPELYLDRHSNPLLGSKQDYQYQLSPKYSATDVLKTLALLGVRDLTIEDFVSQLVNEADWILRTKCLGWHEDLCTILNQSYWIKQFPGKIGKIPLIPLRDGSWASAASIESSPIYFQHEELYIPFGVQIRVVAPSASKNRERKAMFELLGVNSVITRMSAKQLWKHTVLAEQDDKNLPLAHSKLAWGLPL